MKAHRVAALVGLSATTLVTGGCGFLLTSSPPANHQTQAYFSCTEGNAGPILDAILAGAFVLEAIGTSEETTDQVARVRTISLAWAAFAGTSALVGFGKTRRCRDAKRLLAERQATARPVPAPDAAQDLTIRPASDTLRVGESAQLLAEARASSGALTTGLAFSWSSSNDAIASVNGTGRVTGHAAGSVVITVRTGSFVAAASIVVLPR